MDGVAHARRLRGFGEAVELRKGQGADHSDQGDKVIANRRDFRAERRQASREGAACDWRRRSLAIGAVQGRKQVAIAIGHGCQMHDLHTAVGLTD